MDYYKDFDGWNTKKKGLESSQARSPYIKERDIWWVSVGVNLGFEEDGKNGNYVRPILIVKKFNNVVTMGGNSVSVLISQMRVFSSKRLQNKLGELDQGDYKRVVDYLRKEILPPPKRGRG